MGKDSPSTSKNMNPEKGKSLEFADARIEEIVPKSEESQKISDDYRKQKAERAAMDAEEDAQFDNYLKSKGIDGRAILKVGIVLKVVSMGGF